MFSLLCYQSMLSLSGGPRTRLIKLRKAFDETVHPPADCRNSFLLLRTILGLVDIRRILGRYHQTVTSSLMSASNDNTPLHTFKLQFERFQLENLDASGLTSVKPSTKSIASRCNPCSVVGRDGRWERHPGCRLISCRLRFGLWYVIVSVVRSSRIVQREPTIIEATNELDKHR